MNNFSSSTAPMVDSSVKMNSATNNAELKNNTIQYQITSTTLKISSLQTETDQTSNMENLLKFKGDTVGQDVSWTGRDNLPAGQTQASTLFWSMSGHLEQFLTNSEQMINEAVKACQESRAEFVKKISQPVNAQGQDKLKFSNDQSYSAANGITSYLELTRANYNELTNAASDTISSIEWKLEILREEKNLSSGMYIEEPTNKQEITYQEPNAAGHAPNESHSLRRLITEEELADMMNSPIVRDALNIGLTEGKIRRALERKIQRTGTPFVSMEALGEAVLGRDREYDSDSDTDDEENYENNI